MGIREASEMVESLMTLPVCILQAFSLLVELSAHNNFINKEFDFRK